MLKQAGAHGRPTAAIRKPPASGAGETLDARSHALAERVKELKCLQSIWQMLRGGQVDLGNILQEVVDVLPSACQFPDLACASITLKSRQYRTADFRAPLVCHRVEIVGQGMLEVGYRGTLPDGGVPAFLREEQTLFGMVADRVSEIVALKEAENQVATYQEHLRSLAAELSMAEERERRTLAISLHDRIGQGLAVAKLKLETMKYLLPPEHHGRLEDVTVLIKEIVNDTRSLTFDISPPILYELGLEPAVAWLGEHVTRQFGLTVDVRCDAGGGELGEGLRIMLFRSIQELLMNVVKHAHASCASVRLLRHGASHVLAVVEDNGTGFDVSAHSWHPSAASGFGLFSIRERISHLGGRVEIDSGPGRGTRVRLTVPGARAKAPGEEARR